MSTKTSIEWTQEVWNPVTGCLKISPGCKNCYAERIARRFWKDRKFTDVRTHADRLDAPLKRKKPTTYFVNSMSDLFHEDVPPQFIFRVFNVMALVEGKHTFQVLTKRPERMQAIVSEWIKFNDNRPLRNVWLGVSVENQDHIDRVRHLLQTPASVRWISAEPLLGPLELVGGFDVGLRGGCSYCGFTGYIDTDTPAGTVQCSCCVPHLRDKSFAKIDWVVVGGESGPGARPMHPEWARSLRDQCQAAGVPFFFKQWGEYTSIYDRDIEDPDWRRSNMVGLEHPKGRWLNLHGGHGFHGERIVFMDRLGKKAAGRLLDDREWNEFPTVKA